LAKPAHVKVYPVETAEDMYERMKELYGEMDIVIKAAAVADYRPVETHQQKMKKQESVLSIEMERTKDILEELGQLIQHQFLVGFAAETNDIKKYGQDKLKKKNLDAIVINDVSKKDIGFHSDHNAVTILTKSGKELTIPKVTKKEIAKQLLELIEEEVRTRSNANS